MAKQKFNVTQEELSALADPLGAGGAGGVDKGFKFRMIYLLIATLVWEVRLLAYPTEVLDAMNALHTATPADGQYLQLRAYSVMVVFLAYLASYLKNWLFPQVALMVFSAAVAGLIMDFMVFYVYFQNNVGIRVHIFIGLSLTAVACLFYNALHARRAPPMPRKLWS